MESVFLKAISEVRLKKLKKQHEEHKFKMSTDGFKSEVDNEVLVHFINAYDEFMKGYFLQFEKSVIVLDDDTELDTYQKLQSLMFNYLVNEVERTFFMMCDIHTLDKETINRLVKENKMESVEEMLTKVAIKMMSDLL